MSDLRDAAPLEWLVDEAEEALEADGLLILYELAWVFWPHKEIVGDATGAPAELRYRRRARPEQADPVAGSPSEPGVFKLSPEKTSGGVARIAEAFCRVCGYDSDILPWGEDGRTSSFEICRCCGVEWGYEDSLPTGVVKYREQWLAKGAKWTHEGVPHDGLTTEERLSHVPE